MSEMVILRALCSMPFTLCAKLSALRPLPYALRASLILAMASPTLS